MTCEAAEGACQNIRYIDECQYIGEVLEIFLKVKKKIYLSFLTKILIIYFKSILSFYF